MSNVMDRYHPLFEEFKQYLNYVDEVPVHTPKGAQRYRYIGEIVDRVNNDIDSELLGLWMMRYSCNIQHASFDLCVNECEWIKCERKEVIKIKYEPLNDHCI